MQKDIGGIRAGRSYSFSAPFSYPLGSLEVNEFSLCLKSPLTTYELPRDDVVSIRLFDGFLSPGIQIEHRVKATPSFLVFWCMQNRNNIINQLESLHFPVNADTKVVSKPQSIGSLSILLFLCADVLLFLLVIFHELSRSQSVPDAILNAFVLWISLSVVLFIVLLKIFK